MVAENGKTVMTITETLMRPGSWNLGLRGDTPDSIRTLLTYNDSSSGTLSTNPPHIVITSAPVPNYATISDASMLALSLYTGVVTSIEKSRSKIALTGSNLSWWFGNLNGAGPWPVGSSSDAFSSYFSTSSAYSFVANTVGHPRAATLLGNIILAFAMNVMTRGTITDSTTLGQVAGPVAGSFREFMDFICGQFDLEYRFNNNRSIDIGPASALFSTTPSVIVSPDTNGISGTIRGIPGEMSTKYDIGSTVSDVVAVDMGGGFGTATSTRPIITMIGTNNGSLIQRSSSDSAGNASTTAQNLMNLNTSPRATVKLDSAAQYALTRFCRPGDYVYLYDPSADIQDSTNQISFNGRPMFPIKYRVRTLTWPVEQGLNVYLRTSKPSASFFVDLTPYVVFETGGGGATDSTTSDSTRVWTSSDAAAAQTADTGGLVINGAASASARAVSVGDATRLPSGPSQATRGG